MADAKKNRTKAKRLFTRAKNGLQNSIQNAVDADIVEGRFIEFTKRYQDVLEKHEEYVYENEGENVTEDGWIEEIEKDYDDLEVKCFNYIKRQKGKELEVESHSLETSESKLSLEASKLKQVREYEKSNFMKEISMINDTLKSGKDPEVIKNSVSEAKLDAKAQLDRCKIAQANYISAISESEVKDELNWINDLQQRYSEINIAIAEFNNENLKVKPLPEEDLKKSPGLKLEQIPLPKFDGKIRNYPSFKDDFMKQVAPRLTSDETKAYVLKSCLSNTPLEIVKNVDNEVKEMWIRLDERYGKASILTDVVINDIREMPPVDDDDENKFLDLVDTVERGHRDLKRAGLENEISNTSVVSIIEGKLPKLIKREWSSVINKTGSLIDDRNKFPPLLTFLLEQKRIIEYNLAELRNPTLLKEISGMANLFNNKSNENDYNSVAKCWRHKTNNHTITGCKDFLAMSPQAKIQLLRENRVCWSCLRIGHRSVDCRSREPCNTNGCTLFHHKILHECHAQGLSFHANFKGGCSDSDIGTCLLQLMKIKATAMKKLLDVNVLFDGGATLSLITFKKAEELGLEGKSVKLSIVKVGGTVEEIDSYKYDLYLVDNKSIVVPFRVYGMKNISTDIKQIKVEDILKLFVGLTSDEINRPSHSIDVLIGFEYAGCHPMKIQSVDNLLLLENRFGKCLGGSHPLLKERTRRLIQHVTINHIKGVKINDFFDTEMLGIEVKPRCGNCSCGSCPIGGKDYTIAEERELKLIEGGLLRKSDHWEARYPWTRNPIELPDNRVAALGRLRSTERRLEKDLQHQIMYQKQMDEMISRGVAIKVSPEEMKAYNGPIHYISHHEVLNPASKSTPFRIVFNSSASFNGHILNDYWVKGPDLINNLLGILIRFRENKVAVTGDISKMYHSVSISTLDQHTHRFLWRDMELDRDPDVYMMKKVSFGDKPSGNIVMLALRKTAEEGKDLYPRAAKLVLKNTYVDDLIDSFGDIKEATRVTKECDELIGAGGFKVKKWIISAKPVNFAHDESNITERDERIFFSPKESSKVLGVQWNPAIDQFQFNVKVNFSPRRRKMRTGPDMHASQLQPDMPFILTKRIVLSQVNGIYDPLGLAGPFTIKAKVLMRKMWIGEIRNFGWDDPLPEELRKEWIYFFQELFLMEGIKIPRCIQPDEIIGDPLLIIFSDGSEAAYGTAAYVRWKRKNGSYESRLISSKSRISPLKKATIVRLELNGAVLSKRLRVFIEKETRLKFRRIYHIVDSQIVHAMIQSESHGFQTYAAVRIGEIQEHTSKSEWYWANGKYNVADYLTRGRKPSELGDGSEWQIGPDFLKLAEEEWPIKSKCNVNTLPEQSKLQLSTLAEQPKLLTVDATIIDSLASRIKIERYSAFLRLIRVTARILSFYKHLPVSSLTNALLNPTRKDLEDAEYFWVKQAQISITDNDLKKQFQRLSPRRKDDGIIIVGQRVEKWMQLTYNEEHLILIPYHHPFAKLYATFIHKQDHLGVAATVSKIRLKYWIVNLGKMVKSIRYQCVDCRKLCKNLETQVMAQLPIDRLKPAPCWSSTCLDYFGPFETKGETNKRSRGKGYGVIFTCMLTRAVHLDLATDYSTDGFLQVLRRFVAIRGHPMILRSDPGSQLVGASKELKNVIKGLDKSQISNYAVSAGFEWKFSPGDAHWHNGCVEALIHSVKKAICNTIGAQVLMYSELLTVFFEIANIMNERPIGKMQNDIDDGSYLCPNDLLLGRATSRVPSAPFNHTNCSKKRFNFIQMLVDAYWTKWNRFYFPTLLVRQKWHSARRNIMIGDVVLVQDSNAIRGNWKMAKVFKTFTDDDGKVRKTIIEYKNLDSEDKIEYTGKTFTRIERPVQKLVVLLPVDYNEHDD